MKRNKNGTKPNTGYGNAAQRCDSCSQLITQDTFGSSKPGNTTSSEPLSNSGIITVLLYSTLLLLGSGVS